MKARGEKRELMPKNHVVSNLVLPHIRWQIVYQQALAIPVES